MRKLVVLLGSMLAMLMLAACGGGSGPIQEGEQAPDFILPAATGGTVSLDDYTGEQPVLLYFHMAVG